MQRRTSIGDLHLGGVKDRCLIKDGDPPFSFKRDLLLPEPARTNNYKSPAVDTMTFWGPR